MEEYVIELPVCRVCLQSTSECIEMTSLMTNDVGDEETQTYMDCFKWCTNLDTKIEERLPKHICLVCSMELRAAYDFIVKAKNSHDMLMQMEDVKPEYLVHELEAQPNEISEETIFLPVDNVEEIYEEELDCLYDMPLKKEQVEEEEEYENQMNENQFSDSGAAENENIDSNWEPEIEAREEHRNRRKQQFKTVKYDDSVKCNLCRKPFKNIIEMKEHGERKHENIPYRCSICYHRFSNKYTLTEHTKRKHGDAYVTCEICQASVKKTFLRAHKRQVHKNTSYLCSACPRTFKTSTGLQIHSETHKENRERNFECEHCHKKFLTERTYKVHERTHWHREPFKCSLCDKQFMQKVNLKLHMQMHRGETMDCIYCDKKFVRKTDLNVHVRFHTGNFPYECQYCDKRFAIVSHLNYHQKRHQGYIYKCDVCDKEFINMSGLRNHSFLHTSMPFICTVCDKGFPTKFKIKRHLRTVHHVQEAEEVARLITSERIKSEPKIEEVILEEVSEDQSVDV